MESLIICFLASCLSFSEKVAKLSLKNAKNNQEKTIAILDELTALTEEEIEIIEAS
jgi:hypothetical protein